MKKLYKDTHFFIVSFFMICLLCMGITNVYASDYICPESNSRYMTEEDVQNFTLQEANYAKNEVYARHGYLFKSQELREYFSQFSWYNGTITGDHFSESVFNKYEKENVKLFVSKEHALNADGYKLDRPGYDIHAVRGRKVENLPTKPVSDSLIQSMKEGKIEKLGKDISLDLDGDGKKDEVNLITDLTEGFGSYTLVMNGESVDGYAASMHDNLYGVGLGAEEIYLIVFQEGPSDDPEAEFFTWRDGKMISVGMIYSFITDMSTDGEGIIYGLERTSVMDTNWMSGEWEIGQDGLLHLGGSGEYKLSRTDYVLKQTIRVYESCSRGARTREIQPQDISVVSTNGNGWVHIETANGRWGWYEAGALSYEEKDSIFGNLFYAG